MPTTRSRGQTQSTLQFPRRKSGRASVRSKEQKRAAAPSAGGSQPQPPTPTGPLSPCRASEQPPVLSPKRVAVFPLTPSSPKSQTRLPLSPRKRTGDENGCNLRSDVLGSPSKQSRGSPRKLCWDENASTHVDQPSARLLSAPIKSRCQETPPASPTRPERKPAAAQSRFQSVKQALHTAFPERLLGRESEKASIHSFLKEKLLQNVPGSLYISGAPGTGKTACLNCVLQEMKGELSSVKTIVLNCMTLRSSHSVFPLLAYKLKAPGGQKGLQRSLTAPGPMVLLVLDELDQLDSRAQDVLYTVFEWPYLPRSRLCLIGVANALDLTDRILPRLQAQPHCRPALLHFSPYSRHELSAIIQDRLVQASADGILNTSAVQFCARKVSAVSGDARKALDICRRAVEVAEADERKKSLCPAEAKACGVSLPQVATVLSEVYGDRMASQCNGAEGGGFPLQQKLLVCCLLLLCRTGRSKEASLGKLHEAYSRLCARRQVCAVSQGECLALCSLLESRGIFALKKAKEARLTKVFLKIEENDVENALKDRTLLGSILTAGLPS